MLVAGGDYNAYSDLLYRKTPLWEGVFLYKNVFVLLLNSVL